MENISTSKTYLTMSEKAQMLQDLKNGKSRNVILNKYKISARCLRRIVQCSDEINKKANDFEFRNKKGNKSAENPELEAVLFKWLDQNRELGQSISATMLQEKARIFNEMLKGPPTFTASDGWFSRFKKRNGLKRLLPNENILYNTKRFRKRVKSKIKEWFNADEGFRGCEILSDKQIVELFLNRKHNFDDLESPRMMVDQTENIHEKQKCKVDEDRKIAANKELKYEIDETEKNTGNLELTCEIDENEENAANLELKCVIEEDDKIAANKELMCEIDGDEKNAANEVLDITVKRKKRTCMTMSEKAQMLQDLKNGESRNMILNKYKIGERALRRIVQFADEVYKKANDSEFRNKKVMKSAENPELEAVLFKWFIQRRNLGPPIWPKMIQHKARIFNEMLKGPATFTASDAWFANFKRRRGLKTSTKNHVQLSNDNSCAKEFADSGCEILSDKQIVESVLNCQHNLNDLENSRMLVNQTENTYEVVKFQVQKIVANEELSCEIDNNEVNAANFELKREIDENEQISANEELICEIYEDEKIVANKELKRKINEDQKIAAIEAHESFLKFRSWLMARIQCSESQILYLEEFDNILRNASYILKDC